MTKTAKININTKNLKSCITVKAHCSITHQKQQKNIWFLLVLHWAVDVMYDFYYIHGPTYKTRKNPVLIWKQKSWRYERRRREYRGAESAEGGGACGEGVPLSTEKGSGEGLCPLPIFCFIFGVPFAAFWVKFL